MTRVRLVQFQRNTDEPMGITLKLNEEGMSLGTSVYYTYISSMGKVCTVCHMGITLKLNEEGMSMGTSVILYISRKRRVRVCPWIRLYAS